MTQLAVLTDFSLGMAFCAGFPGHGVKIGGDGLRTEFIKADFAGAGFVG